MNEGVQIVLMNGPAASGKSTIARMLQEQASVPYIHMQLDTFEGMLPGDFLGRGFADQRAVLTGLRHGFNASVAAVARHGNRVIVDTVVLTSSWLDEWLAVLQPFSVLFVGVFAQLADLQQREADRDGDNGSSVAERQFDVVHSHGSYDVELNTSQLSVEECTQTLLDYLESDQVPLALEALRTERDHEKGSQQESGLVRK